jgi:hypothetical protein
MFNGYNNKQAANVNNTTSLNIDEQINKILELMHNNINKNIDKTKIKNEIDTSISFIDTEINKLKEKKEFISDLRNELKDLEINKNIIDYHKQDESIKEMINYNKNILLSSNKSKIKF